MDAFIQRGIDNPAKVVTNTSYRQHLVEAIVEDDLAFSIAEKGGTLKLLQHLAPRGVTARVPHQTVRRDLEKLHGALEAELKRRIKVLNSISSRHFNLLLKYSRRRPTAPKSVWRPTS